MRSPTFTMQHFDQLPESARIRGYEFRRLLGIGSSTFYRRVATGAIPQPDKSKTWDVGTVKRVLRGDVS